MCPPLFWLGGQWYVCAPPLLTPHFYFPLELYVYITLTNNNLAFLIYQLIILWTITIKWHRWLLVNNHISNYNSFILVLYRRYINHVSVCPPTFWHLATPLARVLLYAPSHRQDNTYHGLCYTSRGALAGTRNSSMGPPHEGSIRRPIAPWAKSHVCVTCT